MLTSTFVLLKGIGAHSERRLWEDGVADWDIFLSRSEVLGISSHRKAAYDSTLRRAQDQLQIGNLRFFSECLKSREHWRLLETAGERTLFLDIETTGASPCDGDVTVIGLYRNGRLTSLVQGETLTADRLSAELAEADLLVTFFGSVFDLPYLRAKFPLVDFRLPHFDLCFAARRLGFRGGLKHIELHVGLERERDLWGLDGWDAVRLWHRWRAGDMAALDQLLRYNAADTCNLEPLAKQLYAQLLTRFGPCSVTTATSTVR